METGRVSGLGLYEYPPWQEINLIWKHGYITYTLHTQLQDWETS